MVCTHRVIKKYPYIGYGVCVHCWLDGQFPGQWIGCLGPVEWQPRSPNLTTLDFYLWRHLKAMVYWVKVQNMEHLKEHIRDAYACISIRYVIASSSQV